MKRHDLSNTTCPDFSGNMDELKIGAKIHHASSPDNSAQPVPQRGKQFDLIVKIIYG